MFKRWGVAFAQIALFIIIVNFFPAETPLTYAQVGETFQTVPFPPTQTTTQQPSRPMPQTQEPVEKQEPAPMPAPPPPPQEAVPPPAGEQAPMEQIGPPPQLPPQEAPAPPAAAPPEIKQPPKKRGEVSFNFDDADVFSVIQTIFGEILRVNYIIDPQVKGRVNFRSVAPIPVEDVLPLMEVILRLNGIAVVEEAGLYRIVPIGQISKEPAPVGLGREAAKIPLTGKALLQVVPIHYIESSEMVRILTPFLSTNALIVDVPKTNHIIIVDTDANVKRLVQLVELFDSEQLKKIKPQVFIYPVQNSKAKTVADMLQQIFLGARPTTPSAAEPAKTYPPRTTTPTPATPQPAPASEPRISTGPAGTAALVSEATRIFADEVSNTLVILATPDDYAIIEETIKKIDFVPRQVVIEGLVAQVTLTDNLSLGVAWSLKTDINITNIKPFNRNVNLEGIITQSPSSLNVDPTNLSGTGFTFVGTDPSGIVRAYITALARESKAKVLAAPHILVSDNREARIQVGQQVPLVTSETNITGTTNIQRTIQYRDIGIILKVKPQVNESGLISLELSQEISSLGDAISLGDGTSQPTLNKTETTTNLVARDGQTIIIGGLIREDTTKSREGIPFLSKIPILGYLFGSTSDIDSRVELILLLTPHVIIAPEEAKQVTSDYVDRYKGATKDKKIDKFIEDSNENNKNKDNSSNGDAQNKGQDSGASK
ncbi:MAG: secretin N-terminal domain-containing protein [Nitrospirota bacterium]